MPKTIYMLFADYGGVENLFEAAFENESDRNEMALSVAEEIEYANFNQSIGVWTYLADEEAIRIALTYARRWEYSGNVFTWEVPLYGG